MMDIELLKHSKEVSKIAMDIALIMGLCPFNITQIGLAALYHDIGKECIPKAILNKSGKLTDNERQVMIAHTAIGYSILQLNNGSAPDIAAEVALNHHEHYDGTGYFGKQNDEISLASRIIHVADVYSALTSERVYRSAWKAADAIRYTEKNAGMLFDPDVVEAFLVVVDKYEDMLLEETEYTNEGI